MILLTGATGFVGHYLCSELLEQGNDVIAAVRRDDVSLPQGVKKE